MGSQSNRIGSFSLRFAVDQFAYEAQLVCKRHRSMSIDHWFRHESASYPHIQPEERHGLLSGMAPVLDRPVAPAWSKSCSLYYICRGRCNFLLQNSLQKLGANLKSWHMNENHVFLAPLPISASIWRDHPSERLFSMNTRRKSGMGLLRYPFGKLHQKWTTCCQ